MIPEYWPIYTNWFWLMYRTTEIEYMIYLMRKGIEEDEPGEPRRLEDD